MLEWENKTSSVVVDSLINFETVKYFSNEEWETKRYDDYQKNFMHASLQAQSSLSMLNVGQNIIFSIGLTSAMLLASNDVVQGTMTVGDLVLVNTLLFQVKLTNIIWILFLIFCNS